MQVCKPTNHFYLDIEENNRASECECYTADETVTYPADETVTYTADETVTYTADEIVDTNEQLTTDNPDAFSDNHEVNF